MDLRNEIKTIISTLIWKEPVIGLFLSKTRIVAVEENHEIPAYTDGMTIYINKPVWEQKPDSDKPYILGHEALHIVSMHVPRGRKLEELYNVNPLLINVVGDAKVNQLLDRTSLHVPQDRISVRDIEARFGVKDAEKKSMEEIVMEIVRQSQHGKPAKQGMQVHQQSQAGGGKGKEQDANNQETGQGGDKGEKKDGEKQAGGEGKKEEKGKREEIGGDVKVEEEKRDVSKGIEKLKEGKKEGEILNEGEESEAKSEEEMEKIIVKRFAESVMAQKQIGKAPGWAERLLEELLRPQFDWRRLLRKALTKGLGNKVRRTWTRPSRRCDEFPGKQQMQLNKVVVLMDTSGSISQQELQKFAGEIYGIAKNSASVIVIAWDAKVQDVIEIKHPRDVQRIKVHGGGGTVIYPALLEATKYQSAVYVILSDWDIGDLRRAETKELLEKMARKTVAVTTHREPPSLPFMDVLRVRI